MAGWKRVTYTCSCRSALRMSKAAGTRSIRYVVNYVVVPRSAYATRHIIQAEGIAGLPGDVMVCARRISADPYRPDEHIVAVIQRQATTKHVYPTDFLAYHGVIVHTDAFGVTTISSPGIDGVAVLQTVQAATGLYG